MLLLQADLVKSACYIVFPLVQWFRGPVPDKSTLCQISGFFLAAGIEASDIAALMLAIHATFSVVYASRQGRDWSLYKHRGIVYAVYTIFPLLIASLAFIGDGPAFVDVGAYCYLRVDQSWSRTALSWIPRYIIGGFILISYFCLYIFVIHRLRASHRPYKKQSRRGSVSMNRHGHLVTRRPTGVPPVPQLSYNGLMGPRSGSPRPQSDLATLAHRTLNVSPFSSCNDRIGEATINVKASLSVSWAQHSPDAPREVHLTAESHGSRGSAGPFDSTAQLRNDMSGHYPMAANQILHQQHSSQILSVQGFTFSERISPAPGARRRSRLSLPSFRHRSSTSLADFLVFLRISGPPQSNSEIPPSLSLRLDNIMHDPNNDLKYRSHETRHQVRLQFIYPFVYVLMWIFPFIAHTKNYDNAYILVAPIWLYALSTASMSAQGLVDAVLFCFREYPWRYRHDSFWQGLKGRLTLKSYLFQAKRPGRTWEETNADSRFAMIRRNAEIEDKNRELSDETGRAVVLQTKGGQDWWNAYDSDDDSSTRMSSTQRP
jgi:G protein-coupled receptor GPR1